MSSNIIPFTQYLRPDGRQRDIQIEVPPQVVADAHALVCSGYHLECEVLRTGEVSLTVFDPTEEEDIAIEVVPNGPGVREAVARLIAAGLKAAEAAKEKEDATDRK